MNRKAFESLAYSGGFDSFGLQREQFFAPANSKGDLFVDTLVRFGQKFQNAQNESKASLFGFEDMDQAIALPPIPKHYEQWSNLDRLNKERELVGIYISAHPLDEYSVVLKSMCNTRCNELDNKADMAKKQEVVFGGIVTNVRSGFYKNNKPYGIVTIEDYDGAGELALYDDWDRWSGKFIIGATLYIKAKCGTRFPNSTFYNYTLNSVEYMTDVKEKNIDRLTLVLRSDRMTEELLEDITTVVGDNPGKTPLFLQIYDKESGQTILLQAKQAGVNVNYKFISFIESKEEINYFVN